MQHAAARTAPAAPAPAPAHRSARWRPPTCAKPRPKPPFDLTGVWLHGGGPDNGFRFSPPAGFKLTPEAQVHYDAAQKAQTEGKVYRDDIGQCWPAGLPVIMTRVWPIAMMQLPTAIYMVSEFMNSLRVVYLDGRPHSDPDIVVPSFNGESIGRWEGDTLVIDTRHFVGHHHWIDSGIPASDALRIVERMRMINNGQTLEIEYTLTRSQELGRRVEDDEAMEARRTTATSPKCRACPISTITCRARGRRTTSARADGDPR